MELSMNLVQVSSPGYSGISASSAGAVIACPARLALPQSIETAGAAADRGNALHEYARVCATHPERKAEALAAVPEEYRDTARGMNIDGALDGLRVIGCERSYILNVTDRTVRYVGENIERKYNETLEARGEEGLRRYDVPFTVDVEAFFGDVPVELDYKSGQSIGDPSENWQRRICAIGLMLYHGTATAISRVAYIRDNGDIEPDGCEFSMLDVEDYCDTLVRAIHTVEADREHVANGVVPTVYPDRDAQCRYCNAFTCCPYWTNLTKAAMGRMNGLGDVSTLTSLEMGTAMDFIDDVLKVAKVMKDQLREHALKQPLPVGDTYEYKVGYKRGASYFDAAAARGKIAALMSKAGATEEEVSKAIADLTHPGGEVQEVRKRKRHLDVV